MAKRSASAKQAIIGEWTVDWVSIDDLHENPANPRINEAAIGPVAASLRRFGWQQPVVARRSGEVIAGNTRLRAARTIGFVRIPVVWFEGTDLEAVAYAIADNRTSEFAEWDKEALAKLLDQLRIEDALEGVGFDDEALDEILASLPDPFAENAGEAEDPGASIEPPAIPVSQPGDLWFLGDCRLLCGDSTSADDVARLMAGERAHLLATDPPYLVDYDGTNHPADHHKKAGRKPSPGKEVGNKHWDAYVDPESSVSFFARFLELALAHCIERVPIYQWHASRRQGLVEQAWEANDLLVHQTLIWVKSRGILTRSHYLWQHEPCFYGWRKSKMPAKGRRPPTTSTTVWVIDQAGHQDGIHPTQKPLEIFERPIACHTRPGEIVLEPFSGSGSQLVAASRLGRRCFAMELSPAFVDVGVRRWELATGKKAVLDGARNEKAGSFEAVAAARGVDVPPFELKSSGKSGKTKTGKTPNPTEILSPTD